MSKLENLLAITGMSGIYRLKTNRNNGLIVEDLDQGKTQFVSLRKHQFTPLESVAIYTASDSVELDKIFQTMMEKEAELPPVDPKSNNDTLFGYFLQILPEYDPDRVYPNDIRKVIKWYQFLKERDMIGSSEEE
jgi:hypothetical protein